MSSGQRYARIQGDVIEYIEETIVSRKNLADVLRMIETKVPIILPNIPRSAVFVRGKENPATNRTVLYFLCEVQPGVRTINKWDYNRQHRNAYKLAFPWTYFWIPVHQSNDYMDDQTGNMVTNYQIDEIHAFHSPTKYSGLNTQLYPAMVPNTRRESGLVCIGDTGAPANQDIADRIDQLVNEFYLTDFNCDLDNYDILPYRDNDEWTQKTEENVNCWQNWSWGSWRSFSPSQLLEEPELLNVGPIVATNPIPRPELPWTFGRSEEWLLTLNAEDRARLEIGFENLRADGRI